MACEHCDHCATKPNGPWDNQTRQYGLGGQFKTGLIGRGHHANGNPKRDLHISWGRQVVEGQIEIGSFRQWLRDAVLQAIAEGVDVETILREAA